MRLALLAFLLVGASAASAAEDPCKKHIAAGAREKARGCYEGRVKRDAKDLEARNAFATFLGEEKRFEESLVQFELVLARSPADRVAQNGRAMMLLALGRREEGWKALEDAIATDPTNLQASSNMARLALTGGEPRVAEAAWTFVLSQAPKDVEASVGLGEIRLAEGKLEEAARLFSLAVDAAPEHPRAHWMLGRTIAKADPAKAIPYLERATFLAKDDEEVWFDLGNARFAIEDDPGAGQAYTQALALSPEEPAILLQLGKVYLRKKEAVKAERCFLDALSKKPPHDVAVAAHFHRAVAQENDSRVKDAEKSYRRALELEPGHLNARLNLGALLIAQKRVEEAVPELEAVLAADPNNPAAHLNYGIALLARGDREGARAHLSKLRILPNGDPLRVEAERLLSGASPLTKPKPP